MLGTHLEWWWKPTAAAAAVSGAILSTGAAAALAAGSSAPVSLWALTGLFLKVGSVLFGSGYILLAFLRGDLVQRWVTSRRGW